MQHTSNRDPCLHEATVSDFTAMRKETYMSGTIQVYVHTFLSVSSFSAGLQTPINAGVHYNHAGHSTPSLTCTSQQSKLIVNNQWIINGYEFGAHSNLCLPWRNQLRLSFPESVETILVGFCLACDPTSISSFPIKYPKTKFPAITPYNLSLFCFPFSFSSQEMGIH